MKHKTIEETPRNVVSTLSAAEYSQDNPERHMSSYLDDLLEEAEAENLTEEELIRLPIQKFIVDNLEPDSSGERSLTSEELHEACSKEYPFIEHLQHGLFIQTLIRGFITLWRRFELHYNGRGATFHGIRFRNNIIKHKSIEETSRDISTLSTAENSLDSLMDSLLENISKHIEANLESFVLDGIEELACREEGLTNVRKLLEQYEQ